MSCGASAFAHTRKLIYTSAREKNTDSARSHGKRGFARARTQALAVIAREDRRSDLHRDCKAFFSTHRRAENACGKRISIHNNEFIQETHARMWRAAPIPRVSRESPVWQGILWPKNFLRAKRRNALSKAGIASTRANHRANRFAGGRRSHPIMVNAPAQ